MTLEKEEESRLTRFLLENNDVFAWTSDDIPSIDPNFMCHCLFDSIRIQVDRLEEAEAGRGETKGHQGKDEQVARDRVDQGDQLVDKALGFTLLSFMDAYFEYNQIRIHPQDEAKTAFITDSRAFCYKVMPFRLKNVGATY
ncbi:hypothetical protein CR513_55909, partial [Mucuna pruriens]